MNSCASQDVLSTNLKNAGCDQFLDLGPHVRVIESLGARWREWAGRRNMGRRLVIATNFRGRSESRADFD